VHLNRLDEAAELLISRLEDLDRRAAALGAVQSNLDPSAPPAVMRQRARRRDPVSRPDAQRAIATIGRLESFRIPSPLS
jgi:hypothetical protein